jgi:hypothetical protein
MPSVAEALAVETEEFSLIRCFNNIDHDLPVFLQEVKSEVIQQHRLRVEHTLDQIKVIYQLHRDKLDTSLQVQMHLLISPLVGCSKQQHCLEEAQLQ